MKVGKWNFNNGMTLVRSLNRWDRRTNLNETKFVNCFAYNIGYAEFVKDENGKITGSRGLLQDMLYYITERLNLTIEIMETQWKNQLLDNGTWTAGIGLLQREEVDVVSSLLGVNLQRSDFIDYPIPVYYEPITLIAAIPKGVSPNMWVYLEVFGFNQWMLFIAFLAFMAMGLVVIFSWSDEKLRGEFGIKRGSNKSYQLNSASSALAMVFLYTIQMGSHTNSKKLSPRLFTITMSILTLIFFLFYTSDITAEMTSGPPNIPIRTFDEVVLHNYKVITHSSYYKNILARSKPGTAKLEVYNNHFEMKKDWTEAMKAVTQDSESRTLFYGTSLALVPTPTPTPSQKMLTDGAFGLKMDDPVYAIGGLGLQKDSEFLQIFNHYILKALEGGDFKRLYRRNFIDLYTKEKFEMMEAQSLGLNNVLFCFTSLGLGICVSHIIVMLEFMITKIFKEKISANGKWAKNVQDM